MKLDQYLTKACGLTFFDLAESSCDCKSGYVILLISNAKVECYVFCVTCLGNKKQNQQSAKETENTDDAAKSDNVQWNWNVIPGVPDAKIEDTEEYPPFITHAVKVSSFLINQRSTKKLF